MNISASNIILHSLYYNSEGILQCKMRDGELPISPSIEDFLMELHRTYQSKTNKAFASFSTKKDKSNDFYSALTQEMSGQLDFVGFSQKVATCLVNELKRYDFAEQGILLISKYTWTTSNYLFIALLQNHESIRVNEKLELKTSQHIETKKIQLVARIDLTLLEREPNSNRCISFIKGRVGRQVADFFLDFMGAQEGFDTKIQNKVLMQAVDEFCVREDLPVEKKQEVREVAFEYCKEQLKQGEDIDLSTLSDQLQESPKLTGSFYDFVDSDFDLEKTFPVDRSVLRKLTKYVGQGGGVSISFDQKHLGDRIQYDVKTDTLTIVGIPPNLREQLKRDIAPIASSAKDQNAPF
ncbi:nucleoid-associated protein YejK [Psychromonas sp. CD1]|uniref:nucleoid-associated protein YejK n=1 Tax=Psychromonas sp. CD1 TaxID=1979839 RepID=UPI000B9AB791|nr:nucleoid-associated protein YejK [Psychromonas sp. CD1]